MRARATLRSTLAWGFGLAVSVLFLSVWGRSVVVDTDSLAESLSPLARAGIVTDFASAWMAEELVESGADPDTVRPTVEFFFESSHVGETLDELVGEVVFAAASTSSAGSQVDMADLFAPTVPELTVGLAGLGLPVDEGEVSEVVGGLDPLVVREPGASPVVGPSSPTAARLGTAALIALLGIVVLGAGVVRLSEDRWRAVKELLNRVALGGLSFAIFLRLGSWVLDPSGGRAPVQATLSELAGSKWLVPLRVALTAAAIAAAIYLLRRWLIRQGVIGTPEGDDVVPEPSLSQSR